MGVLVLRIPLDTRCIERFSMERTQTRADESEFYNSVRQMMYIYILYYIYIYIVAKV